MRNELKLWIDQMSTEERTFMSVQLGGLISGNKEVLYWKSRPGYAVDRFKTYNMHMDTETVTANTNIRIYQGATDLGSDATPLGTFIDKLTEQAKEERAFLLKTLNLPETVEFSTALYVGDGSIDLEFLVPLALINVDLYWRLAGEETIQVHRYCQELEVLSKAFTGFFSLTNLLMFKAVLENTPLSYHDWTTLQQLSKFNKWFDIVLTNISRQEKTSAAWDTYTEYVCAVSSHVEKQIQKLRN